MPVFLLPAFYFAIIRGSIPQQNKYLLAKEDTGQTHNYFVDCTLSCSIRNNTNLSTHE